MVLDLLAKRYPQLYLTPDAGISKSSEYADLALHGGTLEGGSLEGIYTGSPDDRLYTETTPAGSVEVLFLKMREDFERFYRVMAHRCEPVPVPRSMGAATIRGINNWRKIEAHKQAFLAGGGFNWSLEFGKFTSVKENYQDTVIVVTDGFYSALGYEKTQFGEEEWRGLSLIIRTHHELTHYVCGRMFPDIKHAVFDEILADCMGLVNAVGTYDTALAKAFLGVSPGGYREGGRLENYTKQGRTPDSLAGSVNKVIDMLKADTEELMSRGVRQYDLTLALEEQSERFRLMLGT